MEKMHYLISDASRQVQVKEHVLRYWEDELGLPVPRNELGQRYYTEAHIRLFQRIKKLKGQGYQLKAIRGILEKMKESQKTEPERFLEAQAQALFEEPGTGERNMSRQESMEKEKNTEAENKIEPLNGKKAAEREALAGDADTGNLQTEEPTPHISALSPAKKKKLTAAEIEQLLAGEKMRQFQQIMNQVIGRALQENSERLSQDVSYLVHDKLMKEMEYLMRVADEREEERFKRLDEMLRAYQRENQGRAETAAAAPGRFSFFRPRMKKKKFGRNGNKL